MLVYLRNFHVRSVEKFVDGLLAERNFKLVEDEGTKNLLRVIDLPSA